MKIDRTNGYPSWRRVTVKLCMAFIMLGTWLAAPLVSATILSGGDWKDSNGKLIEAHDGGMFKKGTMYYLYGNDRTYYNSGSGQFNTTFYRLNMYSSTDLVHWTYKNSILTYQSNAALNGNIVERPKILYNDSTKKYVLWFHYDDYNYKTAHVGTAVCDSIDGNYTFVSHFLPKGFDSRDMGVFKDDDGRAYCIAAILNNTKTAIFRLTRDYLGIDSTLTTAISGEGCSVFKRHGRYYAIFSYLTGWSHNDNYYQTATSLSGPWSSIVTLADANTKTYQSQITYTCPVAGTSDTTFMYMGDRWANGSVASRYVWLPLQFNGTTMHLPWYDGWDLNALTGTWTPISNGPNLARGATATASSQWSVAYGPGYTIDSNMTTRWNSAAGTGNGEWLQIDFGKNVTFNKVIINEFENRVSSFKFQYWTGSAWIDASTGTTIGAGKTILFPDIVTSRVRLLVVRASDAVSIYEVQVYRIASTGIAGRSTGVNPGKTDRIAPFLGMLTCPRSYAADGNVVDIFDCSGKRLFRGPYALAESLLKKNGLSANRVYLIKFGR